MKCFLSLLIAPCIALTPGLVRAQDIPAPNAPVSNLIVTAKRVQHGGQSFYALQATGIVRATPAQTWKVLTTYSEMSRFVPNMAASKLVSRTREGAVIEQKWVKRILFFSQTVHLVVRAVEQPMSDIAISLVSGEMKRYSAHWEITPIGPEGIGGTRIRYAGEIEPDTYMPAFFGTAVMQSDVEEMMSAVLAEIERQNPRKAAD